jgi:hypothetical protein
MASSRAGHGAPMIDAAFGQLEHLNEQLATVARKAGNLSLHFYERAVDRALELELEMARRSEQDWLRAQAEMTRELTNAYANAARSVLK